MSITIACFISPHGFGHATRVIAVLKALQSFKTIRPQFITTVPEVLFKTSSLNYSYHPVITDVGLKQRDGFSFDLRATVAALNDFIPFQPDTIDGLQQLCSSATMVVSDISILGIHIARLLNLPSVLVENFTWDWIYTHFPDQDELLSFIPTFEYLYAQADARIQTEPTCNPLPCSLTCQPIARPLSATPHLFRQTLSHKEQQKKLVLITTGGVPTGLPFLSQLHQANNCLFVLTGQSQSKKLDGNVYTIAHDSEFKHQDLIHSADLVICKSGYSTIAECCQSRAAIVCVRRESFAESAHLETFVLDKLGGVSISHEQFLSGQWLGDLDSLLSRKREIFETDGAQRAARFIARMF